MDTWSDVEVNLNLKYISGMFFSWVPFYITSHIWIIRDIRYSGVDRGPCFSFNIQSTSQSRILASLFVPNQNTLVTASSTRNMGWIDYSIQHDSRIHTL